MTDFTRYAIYYAPPPGALADFGAAWLGWDVAAGRTVAHPDLPGLPARVAALTERPRKYGFHATLKPPFALAAGATRAALDSDLATLGARLPPVTLDGLALTRLGSFLALTPEGATDALAALAAACVRTLDPHRAPPSEADLARRLKPSLTEGQRANLTRWGFPYVMGDFRFHITLTGPLPREQAETVQAALAPVLAPLLPRPFPIADLCLFAEAADGRFHILSRHPLRG